MAERTGNPLGFGFGSEFGSPQGGAERYRRMRKAAAGAATPVFPPLDSVQYLPQSAGATTL
jgi:hypothetical protein